MDLLSTPPPILPHVGGRERCCTYGPAYHDPVAPPPPERPPPPDQPPPSLLPPPRPEPLRTFMSSQIARDGFVSRSKTRPSSLPALPGFHFSKALTANSSSGVSPVVAPIQTRTWWPVCRS